MKTNWIQRLLARLGVPVGASVSADVAAVKAETALIVEDTGTTIPGTITTMQGNVTDILADTDELQADWADGGRLDLLIDAIKAVTDALPDAGALSDLADILLDTGTTIPGTITTMQGNVTDILADTDELQGDWADGGRLDLLIDAIKAETDKIAGKMLFTMDFWSDPKEEVQLDGDAAATIALGTVTIADLPTNATIVRAIAMFKFRMIENTNAVANKLDGATVADTSQVIQVAHVVTYYDAINFVADQFSLAAETREGGDVLLGSIDISGAGKVEGNDSHLFRWLLALADEDYLNFNDVQIGLRIWYYV